MALTTLASGKIALGIPTANTTEDNLLNQLITQLSAFIERYCGRTFGLQNYLEYYGGNAQQYLPLNQRPLYLSYQTGTLNGTTTVTGLTDTSSLVAGMPVVGTNPTPENNPTSPAIVPGTTISAINSSTQITLSRAANVSGAQTLFFGCAVWLDDAAYWNTATSPSYTPFANATQLTPGQDYAIDADLPGGTSSQSGLLFNINGYWPEPFTYQVGRISPMLGPPNGNIKVQYTAGYADIPPELTLACNLLVASVRNSSQYGQALKSEQYEDYKYEFIEAAKVGLLSRQVSSVLAFYRNLPIA